MESKFYTLIFEFYNKNNIGGILRGDHVTFSKDWEKIANEKKYPEHMKNVLTRLANTKNRLIVTDVNRNSSGAIGNPIAGVLPEDIILNVAEEISPGLPIDSIPVPLNLIQRVENGINLGQIPDCWKTPVVITQSRTFDPKKDSIDTEGNPDYTKYKKLAHQHILDRQKEGHKPEQKGIGMTGQTS
jgi:hypothetical protein